MTIHQAILIFLRAPEPGKVKTRLSKRLGTQLTFSLYKNFVQDTMETVQALGIPVRICFYPPEKKDDVTRWLGNHHTYWSQTGDHLGQRMANSFARAFETGVERAVLIGTDIPDLPGHIIEAAFDALDSHEAVIGPSTDGGYYLIGFNATGFLPAIFNGIRWGQPDVLIRTMAIFSRHGASVHRLPVWRDIDEVEDLLSFAKRNTGNTVTGKNTTALIAQGIQFPE
ncbi:MAG: TIGR04282 family arsenosugar biosynthesis glycosyltransferase [Pseudomonadota bacterium]